MKCWSFAYTYEGGRYSTEIPAATREEAEQRLKALANARCEGPIAADPNLNKMLTSGIGASSI